MSTDEKAGDNAVVEAINATLTDIKGRLDKFVTKDEIATVTKSMKEVETRIGEIHDRELDKPRLGLPFADCAHLLHTMYKAGKGDETAKKMIFGDKGYVAKVDAWLATKAPTGFATTGNEGELFIFPEYASDIQRTPPTVFDMEAGSRNIPMSGNLYRLRALVDKNHTTSVSGGIVWNATPEGGVISASTAEWEYVELKPTKQTGAFYYTDEMAEDATAFTAYIPPLFMDALASRKEDHFLWGSGVGEPLGALSTANPALITVTRTTASTVKVEDITNMKARAQLRNWSNYVWIANQSIIPKVLQMVNANQTIYMSSAKTGEEVDTILGRPVYYSDGMAALGSAGDLALIDRSQYAVGTKGGVKTQSSIHVRFLYGESVVRFIVRYDGQPLWRAALTPKNNGDTRSPFIRLGTT